MNGLVPIQQGWHNSLGEIASAAREHLTIAAPFITTPGASAITQALHPTLRAKGRIDVVTDLSPDHVYDGAIELTAVQGLPKAVEKADLWHVPRFHAKIYLADGVRAIVTSGNLTAGAFFRNIEYGFDITDPTLVASVGRDLADTKFLGVLIGEEQLSNYLDVARHVRESYLRQQTATDPALKQAFDETVRTAEEDLVRFRLAGGAMHTVFARTIVYLLKRFGPMRTEAIHQLVQSIHPELCDDSVDRVIDGKHYGKKWKHAVRTAQQQDKRLGLVTNDGDIWRATEL